MPRTPHIRRAIAVFLVVGMAVAALSVLPGCDKAGVADSDVPPEPQVPHTPLQTTPELAVVSYLDWISLAYRVSNSEMASRTFTPYEEVRVSSYVQYNNEQGRAIDQRYASLDIDLAGVVENTATVTARETWTYRYVSLATQRYSSQPATISYDTTYTVVRGEDGLWRVDRVEAAEVRATPVP